MDRTEMMNCLAVIERTFYGQRSGITAARAIAHIEALEVENAALLQQMQEMVRMAAEKNRPAYDEQQRVIMELRDENAALKARGLSEDDRVAFEEFAESFGLDLSHIDFAWLVWKAATQAMERAKR